MKARVQSMSGAGLLVVASMCGALLLVVLTVCVLGIRGHQVPDGLDRALQGLLVGVPALLARTYKEGQAPEPDAPPTPVEVVNDPKSPVPTTDQDPAVDRDPVDDQVPPPLDSSGEPTDVLPLADETPRTVSRRRPSKRPGSSPFV